MENKRNYKIVASDLDGTLLNKKQAVSEENFCAISEMKRLGVEFVPTTGRAMNEIDLSLINSPDIRYIITSNGAVAFDKNIGKPILTRYISKNAVSLIFEAIRPYNAFLLVHAGGKTYFDKNKYDPEFMNICGVGEYYGYIIGEYAEAVEDFESYLLSSNEVELMCLFFELDEGIRFCNQTVENCGTLSAPPPPWWGSQVPGPLPPSPPGILNLGGGRAISITDRKSKAGELKSLPRVTCLVRDGAGLTLRCVPHFGHFSRQPLVTADRQEDQLGDRVPLREPSTHRVPTPRSTR